MQQIAFLVSFSCPQIPCFPNSQIPNFRFLISNSRFPVSNSRFPVSDSQSKKTATPRNHNGQRDATNISKISLCLFESFAQIVGAILKCLKHTFFRHQFRNHARGVEHILRLRLHDGHQHLCATVAKLLNGSLHGI